MSGGATGPVVLLMGPTASGKTELALTLAERLPLEIVSVDSALVYRGLDIGTAKPSAEARARVPHHLIDVAEPDEHYSAGRFCADALACIEAIHERGRIPLLTGGTMLYFRVLLDGIAPMPPADPDVRRQLEAETATGGLAAMHAELARVDPAAAARIHAHDPQRVQRALEVWRLTGRPISEWQADRQPLAAPTLQLCVAPGDRQRLHDRIERRFHAMLQAGLVEEVERLRARPGMDADLPSMRAVGYRQVWQYLAGEVDHAGMVERAVVATRQLAKRQFTWLRRFEGAHWFDSDTVDGAALETRLIAFRGQAPEFTAR